MTTDRKIALITGGSRGLGRNSAIHLAAKGIDTILTYRTDKAAADETVAEIAKAGGTAIALQLDTAEIGGFDDFASRLTAALKQTWGREQIDFLVNNAGSGVFKSFAETTESDFDAMLNVHLKGVFFLTQKLAPMIADGGRILNISSGLTRFALPGFAAYATMKGGIEVLTTYLAKELAERQITVNVLAPGAIETDFGGGMVRDNAEMNAHIASTIALGRVGQPDDIGGAVSSYLAGDFGWMTAQRIEVSGGQLI